MNKIIPLDNSWMIRNVMILAIIYNWSSIKNAVNDIAEGNIPMNAMFLRCGCETKSLHKIFTYVFTSMSNDRRYGKALDH